MEKAEGSGVVERREVGSRWRGRYWKRRRE
jgi:hypothetical protein